MALHAWTPSTVTGQVPGSTRLDVRKITFKSASEGIAFGSPFGAEIAMSIAEFSPLGGGTTGSAVASNLASFSATASSSSLNVSTFVGYTTRSVSRPTWVPSATVAVMGTRISQSWGARESFALTVTFGSWDPAGCPSRALSGATHNAKRMRMNLQADFTRNDSQECG